MCSVDIGFIYWWTLGFFMKDAGLAGLGMDTIMSWKKIIWMEELWVPNGLG